MLAITTGGASATLPDPPQRIRPDVDACLASLWPVLLAASNAADGPDPESAAQHLRAAGELLLAAADRIR